MKIIFYFRNKVLCFFIGLSKCYYLITSGARKDIDLPINIINMSTCMLVNNHLYNFENAKRSLTLQQAAGLASEYKQKPNPLHLGNSLKLAAGSFQFMVMFTGENPNETLMIFQVTKRDENSRWEIFR